LLEESTLLHQQEMEDVLAGNVSQHLMLLVMVTALSSSPFVFPEAWRSTSQLRDSNTQVGRQSPGAELSAEQGSITEDHSGSSTSSDPSALTHHHSGSSGCGNDAPHFQSAGT